MSCVGTTPVRYKVCFDDNIRDRMWRRVVGDKTRTADAVGSPVWATGRNFFSPLVKVDVALSLFVITNTTASPQR